MEMFILTGVLWFIIILCLAILICYTIYKRREEKFEELIKDLPKDEQIKLLAMRKTNMQAAWIMAGTQLGKK